MNGPRVPPDAVLGLLEPAAGDPLWWLSFCDPAKISRRRKQRPGGPSFLGAVITQAPTLAAAVTRSHALGVNPGGEIQIVGPLPAEWIGPEWRDRLLSQPEIKAIPEPGGEVMARSPVTATFTCYLCGGTFEKGWSEEEARAEAEGIFTPAELAAVEVVCDDCYRKVVPEIPRLRAEVDQCAAAAGLSYDEYMRGRPRGLPSG